MILGSVLKHYTLYRIRNNKVYHYSYISDSPASSVPSSSKCIRTPCGNLTVDKERGTTSTSCSDKLPLHTAVSKKSLPTSKPVSKLVDDITDVIVISEQPIMSVNLVNDTDFKQEKHKCVPTQELVEVIDLTDSLEDADVGVDTECIEEDNTRVVALQEDGKIRKSRRNIVKKSPAWKNLIPGKKTTIKPAEIKKEIIDRDKTEAKMANISPVVKLERTVKRNLLDSLTGQSTQTSTPAKTLTVGKTPAKTPITSKLQ